MSFVPRSTTTQTGPGPHHINRVRTGTRMARIVFRPQSRTLIRIAGCATRLFRIPVPPASQSMQSTQPTATRSDNRRPRRNMATILANRLNTPSTWVPDATTCAKRRDTIPDSRRDRPPPGNVRVESRTHPRGFPDQFQSGSLTIRPMQQPGGQPPIGNPGPLPNPGPG